MHVFQTLLRRAQMSAWVAEHSCTSCSLQLPRPQSTLATHANMGNRTGREGSQFSLLVWLQEGGKERKPKFFSTNPQKTLTSGGSLHPPVCSQKFYFLHQCMITLEENRWKPCYSAALWQPRAERLPSDIQLHCVRSSDRWEYPPFPSKATSRLETQLRNETLILFT